MSMATADIPKPAYAHNMRAIGHSDQGGRPDAVQVMVNKGHAYVSHLFSNGFSVIDVRDPKNPKAVGYYPCPENTWNLHCQTYDDLLLVVHAKNMWAQPELADERNYYKGKTDFHAQSEAKGERNWSAGMAVYDISKPAEPKQIGFLPIDGGGIHRIWYVGGRWAYASALIEGFSDYIFITIDMADPANPREAGRFWLPGMNLAAGEKTNWPTETGRYGCHHGVVHGDTAYCAWRDANLVVVDVKDRSEPEAHRPQELVAAVPGRHAQLPAAPRSRPAARPRRGRPRQDGGRHEADLGVRQPRAVEPGQHLHLPARDRHRLSRGRRALRPAQRLREPARRLRQRQDDLHHLPERRRARVRHRQRLPAEGDRRVRRRRRRRS